MTNEPDICSNSGKEKDQPVIRFPSEPQAPPGRKVRDVLKLPSHAIAYCYEPHQNGRTRAVAVLTDEPQPHLVTDLHEVPYPDTGTDQVFAPCFACGDDAWIDVAAFKALRAQGKESIALEDVRRRRA